MRHLEIKDLWLQEEVIKGWISVEKVPGGRNPADLMTKFLGEGDIGERLRMMGMRSVPGNRVGKPRADEAEGGKSERGERGQKEDRRRWADMETDDDDGMEEVLGLWRVREGSEENRCEEAERTADCSTSARSNRGHGNNAGPVQACRR